jgi:hypothetical protein
LVEEMTRPRSEAPPNRRYGLGLWLDATSDALLLVSSDAGVSFRTMHRPSTGLTVTVVSNSTDGAWPLVRSLDGRFGLG